MTTICKQQRPQQRCRRYQELDAVPGSGLVFHHKVTELSPQHVLCSVSICYFLSGFICLVVNTDRENEAKSSPSKILSFSIAPRSRRTLQRLANCSFCRHSKPAPSSFVVVVVVVVFLPFSSSNLTLRHPDELCFVTR